MKKYNGIIKLVVLLILAPIIIWKFGLKQTADLYWESKQLTNYVPSNISKTSNEHYPSKVQSLLGDGSILQLCAANLVAENIKTVDYAPEIIDSEGGYNLYCGTWTLTGRFIHLVKLVSQIERQQPPLRISSLCFEVTKPRQEEKKLIMTVSFINIEK